MNLVCWTRAAVLAVTLAFVTSAHADFMDDFFTSAGAAANVTPADVMRGQNGNFVAGGSVVWRVPQRSFTPFSFQAPSLKMGCGGVDFFAGSFGFANSAEFVNYLRNIGQNAVGLFFQMALRSMAPQLHDTMQEISKDIQKMNSFLGNSCQMAQQLVNATGWGEKTAMKQANRDVAQGGSTGIYDAYTRMKASLGDALGVAIPAAEERNSGGSPAGAVEHNVTWLALNSGQLAGVGAEYQKLAMSLLGTVIYMKDPDPGRNVPMVLNFGPQKVTLPQIAGRWNENAVTLRVYDCGLDITNKCLTMVESDLVNFKPFARRIYDAMTLVRGAIIARQDVMLTPGGPDALRALGTTRLPLFKVLALTSSPGMAGLSDMLIRKYADLVGVELAANFVETMTYELGQATAGAKKDGSNVDIGDLANLERKLVELRREAGDLSEKIATANGSQADLIAELGHLERSVYASFNARLMDNLRYAGGTN